MEHCIMLPIIDIAPLRSCDRRACGITAGAIGAACQSAGFFYVRNHGVSQQRIDAALAASRQFFALPETIKHRVRRQPGHYRGYISTMPFSEDQASGEPLLYEAFIVGEEVDAKDPETIASAGLYSPNIWPTQPPGFKSAISDYWNSVTDLSRHLLRAFSLALGCSESELLSHFRKSLSNISLLHYPPRPAGIGNSDVNARAHFDTDVVTILLPGEVGGLQVLHRDGGWMDVDPLPGCLVVNIGNMLELWSGGRFRSTMHRVHPPIGVERYSIGYFAHPGYETVISPLPGTTSPKVRGKPTEIHAGEDLAAFVAKFDAE
jgi:isopenicillin N synthase-like dioxygenase